MEQFLGLSRDASKEKAEPGTSPYNRNIVYDKQLGSITQENGFEHSHFVKGVLIGEYSTNTHIVYITYDIETGNNIISYLNTANNVVTEVINTQYFGYEITRPIEIIAWYNYNQELIIMFSDGVFTDSSAPRLINLMNIGVPLDINLEFLSSNDASRTFLFSIFNLPRYSISYGGQGTHDAQIVFFTIAYILPDGITRTKFIPVLAEAFPTYELTKEFKRDVVFTIEDLDTSFTQFIIGIITYQGNALFGYTTDILPITSTSYVYNFNSTTNLISTTVEDIVVESSVFTKVKSLTIGNDSVILGGVVTKSTKSYQKYANNIKLNLYFDERDNNRSHAPILCPDEAYYFTIAVAFDNGSFSEEYHIPNRDPEAADLAYINKTAMGLVDLPDANIPSFMVINRGDWDNPSVGLPNFDNLAETKLNWGFWQNEELYPNVDDFNGAIDYDGVTVIPSGRDLRSTNVKLHRVPGLDNIVKKFPCRLGIDIMNPTDISDGAHTRMPAFSVNVDNFMDAFSTVIASDKITGYRLSFVKKDNSSKLVEDINFIKPICINANVLILSDTAITINHQVDTLATNYPNTYSTIYPKYTQFGISRIKSINHSAYKGLKGSLIAKANYGVFDYLPSLWDSVPSSDNPYNDGYNDVEKDLVIANTLVGVTAWNRLSDKCFKIPDINYQYGVVKNIEHLPGNNINTNSGFTYEQVQLKVRNSKTTYTDKPDYGDAVGNVPDPNPDYGWNPLKYFPASLADDSPACTLPIYNPTTSTYVDTLLARTDAGVINATNDQINVTNANISLSLINYKKNIHQGLNPSNFVVVGFTNIDNPTQIFKDCGDVFTSSIYNEILEFVAQTVESSREVTIISYFQLVYYGLISIENNALVSFTKDRSLGQKIYLRAFGGTSVDTLNTFNYEVKVNYTSTLRKLNDIIANTSFNRNIPYLSNFPFRIVKSLVIQSENLSTLNVRTYLINSYYDLPSNRGEITYVVGFDKGVYCQQRYSLCLFKLKEKLNNNSEDTAYLVETDLFEYKPTVIVDEDNKGYIGGVHQFGKKLSKDGLLTLDAERGKVYLIAGITPKELSKVKMVNYFKTILTPLTEKIIGNLFNDFAIEDNPYNGTGILFGIDDKTNRILLRINYYDIKEGVTVINGIPYSEGKPIDIKNPLTSDDKGVTLSFNLDWNRWVAEHDYNPQFFINTNKVNYAGINVYSNTTGVTIGDENKIHTYITNKVVPYFINLGKYFYLTDDTIYESYTDLLFNSRYDLSKWYKSIMWRSTAKDINGKRFEDKTISAIILYTDYQCSGRVELDIDTVSLVRNSEGVWTFNEFRDMVKDSSDLPIEEDGTFDVDKVHLNRTWFDKSDFISNFIIVRLIMNNTNNIQVAIHNVNVEARISERI